VRVIHKKLQYFNIYVVQRAEEQKITGTGLRSVYALSYYTNSMAFSAFNMGELQQSKLRPRRQYWYIDQNKNIQQVCLFIVPWR
jgi:hypothetical protein